MRWATSQQYEAVTFCAQRNCRLAAALLCLQQSNTVNG
jgi:hypothetical protein